MPSDKIYYYDVYNDLGDPVKGFEYMRPTLEGEKNPHPRRCCTRCPHTSTGECDFYRSLLFTSYAC